MEYLSDDLERVLNEREPVKQFTNFSDETKHKLCDPGTPFHEWDYLCFDLLKYNTLHLKTYSTIGDGITHWSRAERDSLWNCDEVCDELTPEDFPRGEVGRRRLHRTGDGIKRTFEPVASGIGSVRVGCLQC